MRRPHRALHRKAWPLLGLAVGAALVLALALRPPPETVAETPSEGTFTVLEVLR